MAMRIELSIDIKIGYIFITGAQYSDVVFHFNEAIFCQLNRRICINVIDKKII